MATSAISPAAAPANKPVAAKISGTATDSASTRPSKKQRLPNGAPAVVKPKPLSIVK